MAITTPAGLLTALAGNSTSCIYDKASLASTVAGQFFSLWRATGVPGQAAIPSAPEVPTASTLGAFFFPNQVAPATSYLAWMYGIPAQAGILIGIFDRVAHSGGKVLNSTTLQTVGLDLDVLAPSAARAKPGYRELAWYLEVYADGGATASNAAVNVTFTDDSSVNLNNIPVGGTLRSGRLIELGSYIPIAHQGKQIRSINTVTLSASTGTAGNFGFTCVRPLTVLPTAVVNRAESMDWAQLGLPEIPNDSCLALYTVTSATSTGIIRGQFKLAHG